MEMKISVLLINSCTNNSEKTELTASIKHIEKFPKSGILIYHSEVLEKTGRKTRRRRTQEIAKRYVFHANAQFSESFGRGKFSSLRYHESHLSLIARETMRLLVNHYWLIIRDTA